MPDLLCLRFRESHIGADEPVGWALLSAAGMVESSGHALLRDIPETLAGSETARRCMVIVGCENVLLSGVDVPAKQQRHLRQLVPFLVEEQIVDPIEAMHLAMPVLHSGEQVSVAAIRRSLLEEWLDNLFDAGIAPDYLFIDVLCVPRKQGDWQLLFDESRLLFRDGPYSGMVLAPQTADTVLQLALAAMPEVDNNAVHDALDEIDAADAGSSDIINRAAQRAERDAMAAAAAAKVVLIDSESAASEQTALAELAAQTNRAGDVDKAGNVEGKTKQATAADAKDLPHDPHEAALLGEDYVNPGDLAMVTPAGASDALDAAPENWLQHIDALVRSENISTARMRYRETVSELLAISAAQNLDSGLNLLQGDFRPATANAAQRRFLRKISGAVAACVAMFLVITLGGGFYLNYRGDKNFDKSVALYRELFPKQRKVVDPVSQMKRQLRGSSIGATTSDFLPLLDAASRSLQSLETGEGDEPAIKQLRYDTQRGHIAIDLQTGNIDQLEAYRDLLTAEGLKVDILSANQDGDTIKGRIQVGRS